VHPVEADFMQRCGCPRRRGTAQARLFPRLDNRQHGRAHRGRPAALDAETLGRDAMLLIGMDLVKDVAVLEAAYDDAQG
jgi:hypothetical protein